MMTEFVKGWPDSFNKPLPKRVKTMHAAKPSAGMNLPKTYDSSAIYTRVIGLQASGRDLNLQDVLSYELAAVPISLFTETGDLRISTTKATLKTKLKVEVSVENIPKPTDIIITFCLIDTLTSASNWSLAAGEARKQAEDINSPAICSSLLVRSYSALHITRSS